MGNFSSKNMNNMTYTHPDILNNKVYCCVDFHSNVEGIIKNPSQKHNANKFVACQSNKKNTPDLLSCIPGNSVNNADNTKAAVEKTSNNNDKSPNVLWYIENNIINVDESQQERKYDLNRNMIPIPSSTRPLGLPYSTSYDQRRHSRFRYRHFKNVTSLSRPLLIG